MTASWDMLSSTFDRQVRRRPRIAASLRVLRASTAVSCLLLSLVAGCSREGHGDAEETGDRRQGSSLDPTPVPLAELQSRMVKSYCEYHFNCPQGEGGVRAVFQSLSTCQTRILAMASRWPDIPDLTKAIEAGTITYDAAAAGRCFAEHPCVDDLLGPGNISETCPEIFKGALLEGDACWRSEECARETYCDHGHKVGGRFRASCPGVCKAPIPIGGACEWEDRCADPPGRDYGVCDEGTCVRQSLDPGAAEGAACGTIIHPNGRHEFLGWCGEGLWCSSGTCRRDPLPTNSPCTDEEDRCSGIQVCDLGDDFEPETQQAVGRCRDAKYVLEDEPCGESHEEGFEVGFCYPYAFECVNGRCQRPGDGSLGARCIEEIPNTCNEGLQCNFEKVCLRLRQVGEECHQNQECESGGCNGRCEDGQCTGRCLPRMCAR